jgi:hypothetical protein
VDKNCDNPSHPADSFPDVRWSHDRPILRKPVTVFASSKVGSWLIRTATPLDRWILQRSNSRYTILGPLGLPLLLLTTVGRKTGQPHTTPLTYVRENGQLFVVEATARRTITRPGRTTCWSTTRPPSPLAVWMYRWKRHLC